MPLTSEDETRMGVRGPFRALRGAGWTQTPCTHESGSGARPVPEAGAGFERAPPAPVAGPRRAAWVKWARSGRKDTHVPGTCG
jgi:hypothetical protein